MNICDYKYKTELHLHTSPASSCSEIPPEKAVETYAKLGYDSIVVCNHFYPGMRFVEDKETCIREYLADYDKAVETGKRLGVHVILGCELRFTENNNDYLIYGIDRDFLFWAFDRLDAGIEAFSKEFRSEDHLIVQAHPFRNGMTHVEPELLDGIEAFNMHPSHNSRVAIAARYAREHNMIMTAGTDYHHPGHEGCAAILTREPLTDSHDIVKLLKSGDYIFEVGGCKVLP